MLENPALGRYFPTFGFGQSGIWLSDNFIGGLLTKCLKIPPWGGIFQRWLSDMRGITLGKADAIAPRRRRMLPQPLANDLLRKRITQIGEQSDLHKLHSYPFPYKSFAELFQKRPFPSFPPSPVPPSIAYGLIQRNSSVQSKYFARSSIHSLSEWRT